MQHDISTAAGSEADVVLLRPLVAAAVAITTREFEELGADTLLSPATLSSVIRLVRHDAENDTLTFEGASRMVDLVRTKREQILRLARRHGVTGVRVFGSMARGDAGPHSDVDLLVEVGPDPSPWFPGGLVAELEELLGRRVQVVTERGLDELLRDRVLEEAVPL